MFIVVSLKWLTVMFIVVKWSNWQWTDNSTGNISVAPGSFLQVTKRRVRLQLNVVSNKGNSSPLLHHSSWSTDPSIQIFQTPLLNCQQGRDNNYFQVENAEVREPKYENRSTEVRRKAIYPRLVLCWLTTTVTCSQRMTVPKWCESQIPTRQTPATANTVV